MVQLRNSITPQNSCNALFMENKISIMIKISISAWTRGLEIIFWMKLWANCSSWTTLQQFPFMFHHQPQHRLQHHTWLCNLLLTIMVAGSIFWQKWDIQKFFLTYNQYQAISKILKLFILIGFGFKTSKNWERHQDWLRVSCGLKMNQPWMEAISLEVNYENMDQQQISSLQWKQVVQLSKQNPVHCVSISGVISSGSLSQECQGETETFSKYFSFG